ncbi:unnamed protein product [Peronospora effusa]|nr:unnamed protein product [Peronospora effusa]
MVAPSRPRQPPVPNARQEYREKFGRPSRHVPTDKFFADIAEAQARSASADELRVLALREVQRSRVATDDKVKLFIPESRIASEFGIDDILHAINREPQSSTWDQALNSLCDFVCVKGHGIRFTCTNRDLAIKIGGTAVTCMGQKLIVKPYSAYERCYYVDLTRIPSDLEEDAIYDYFVRLGLQPIIAPTHLAGSLMSQDRTVWFPQHDVPAELMPNGQPLREIVFPGFESPVFVQHKKRSLNKVLPPSIAARRAAAPTPRRAQVAATSSAPVARATAPASPTSSPDRHLPEGVLILDRPASTAPVQAWVKVTRHALCSRAPNPSVAAELETTTSPVADGHLVFGFPVTPTSYELAFSEHDLEEPTAGDADCVAFAAERPIRCSPRALPEPVGSLVSARSVLTSSSTTLKRSEYRRRARRAAQDLTVLNEPEDRVAAITAQPSAYAPIVHSAPSSLSSVVDEHTLLRIYSGQPSTTHGYDCSFMKRLHHDYPGDMSPPTSTIIEDRIPDDESRDLARSYALIDLFLRTHAPAIYHDPVKVQALCGATPVSCYQYSHFLLWTDQTLAGICQSQLGQDYCQYLSLSVSSAMALVLDDCPCDIDDSVSMASSDSALSRSAASDDDSLISSETTRASHL